MVLVLALMVRELDSEHTEVPEDTVPLRPLCDNSGHHSNGISPKPSATAGGFCIAPGHRLRMVPWRLWDSCRFEKGCSTVRCDIVYRRGVVYVRWRSIWWFHPMGSRVLDYLCAVRPAGSVYRRICRGRLLKTCMHNPPNIKWTLSGKYRGGG